MFSSLAGPLYCSVCADDRTFERPPCSDGHGGDCPELVCTGCGTARISGSAPPLPPAGDPLAILSSWAA